MAKGDHLFVWRYCRGVPFQHHAVDVGDGTVIHFTDGSGGIAGPGVEVSTFEICRTSISVVTRGGRDSIHVVPHAQRLEADEAVDRALQHVGRRGYDLLFDNCEHFAVWCVRGSEESRQVHLACERLGAAGAKVAVAGALRVAGRLPMRGMIRSSVMRGASPWLLAADVAQWGTEAMGHHLGLRNPEHRRTAGRAVGITTSIGVGAIGGPVGMFVSGSLWAAGELVGEITRVGYERVRSRKLQRQGEREPARRRQS